MKLNKFLWVNLEKKTLEGGSCDKTTAKKVIALQREMTKKGFLMKK